MRNTWKLHAIASLVLVVIAAGLSAFIWSSSTAGYAKSGILEGADLRKDLIILCWLATGTFIAASSIVVAIGTRLSARRARILASAYVLAGVATFIAMRVADHYM